MAFIFAKLFIPNHSIRKGINSQDNLPKFDEMNNIIITIKESLISAIFKLVLLLPVVSFWLVRVTPIINSNGIMHKTNSLLSSFKFIILIPKTKFKLRHTPILSAPTSEICFVILLYKNENNPINSAIFPL